MIWRNYIKASIRNLLKQKGYTIINIAGLAIGLAAALLLSLYVYDELSYDKFHPNANRIVRVAIKANFQNTSLDQPTTSVPLGPALVQDYPMVKSYCRIRMAYSNLAMRVGNRIFNEADVPAVDSTFFEVFNGFKLLAGDPSSALARPNTLVLTESYALKYFGIPNPIGKVIYVGTSQLPFEVTGIVHDFPENSHFRFNILVSTASLDQGQFQNNWLVNNIYTYLLLDSPSSIPQLQAKFPVVVQKYIEPLLPMLGITKEQFVEQGYSFGFHLQPLTAIHLDSHTNFELRASGSRTMVYIFILIALFVIGIASINFTNLATAKSASRAREAGMRKILGSSKGQLVSQFLVESVLLTFISLIFALEIVNIALPWFNDISGKSLAFSLIPLGSSVALLGAIVVAVGILAGSYPAIVLAGFDPLAVLKGKLSMGTKGKTLRRVLVAIQFIITIGLLASTFVVYRQLNYLYSKDLGFDKNRQLIISRAYCVPDERRIAFKEELQAIPGVESSTFSNFFPSRIYSNPMFRLTDAPSQEFSSTMLINTDYSYAETMKLQLVEGRYFSKDFSSDSSAVVINQAAAVALKIKGQAVGKTIHMTEHDGIYTIVGMVKDYHTQSLRTPIAPLVMMLTNHTMSYVTIKIASSANLHEVNSQVEKVWKRYAGNEPFNYTFLDQQLDGQYKIEQSESLLLSGFSILAIIIASLGLLGLASFTAEQRTKEVGLRKVLGANSAEVSRLLLRETNLLFVVATLLAWPIAYFLMSRWLQNFPYSITIHIWEFILASTIAYAIAIATVLYQTLKAAATNPSVTLKHE